MFHKFSKGKAIAIGGDDDGWTIDSPFYWYRHTDNWKITGLNNSNSPESSNRRIYIRVYLKAGTNYQIGTSSVFDGKIWLYDINGNELTSADDSSYDVNGEYFSDIIDYTPSTSGVYIIGAGAYSDGQGDMTVCCYPQPEQEEIPESTIVYETSSGFNALGKPIEYRSASQAGVAFSTFINQSTVFALDSNKGDTELVSNLTPTYSNGSCLQDSTFKFDGDSKYATYPTQGVSNVNLDTGAFTIEWDCKIGTNHYGIYPSFICMGQSWSTAGCYIIQWQRAYSGGLSSHWNGSFDADCYPTTTFPQFNGDGLYHHIAITRDTDGLYCFWVDGKQLADTYSRTLHLDLSYTNLDFGYNRIDGGRLEYDMKHFRISNKCLYTKDFNIPKWVGA